MTIRHMDSSGAAQRSRRETAAIDLTVIALFIAIILGLGNSIAILAPQLALLFILTLFVIRDAIIKNFDINMNYGSLCLLFAILASMIFSTFISFSDASSAALVQIKYAMTFLSTLYIVWIFHHCLSNNILSGSAVIKAAIYAFAIYSVAKLITNALIAFEIIQITLLDSAIRQTLGTTFVRSSLIFGLIRINFPPDFGIPIILFCTLTASKLNINISRFAQVSFTILLIISALIAYSRYIWAATFIAVLFATLIVGRRLFFTFSVITILMVGAAATSQAIVEAVEYRFFSQAVEQSDSIRENQQFALTESLIEAPFGKGLATYVPWLVRSKNSPYSYELQILATAMQFGLIGILPVLFFMISLVSTVRSKDVLVCTAVYTTYFCWVMTGFTNPSLIGRAAAMVFVVFICVARLSPQLEWSSAKARGVDTPVRGAG